MTFKCLILLKYFVATCLVSLQEEFGTSRRILVATALRMMDTKLDNSRTWGWIKFGLGTSPCSPLGHVPEQFLRKVQLLIVANKMNNF